MPAEPVSVEGVKSGCAADSSGKVAHGEHGFTLIELLIVVVVLGVLAGIVVFAVQSLTGSSAVAACTTDARTVQGGVEMFNAQAGYYPSTTDELTGVTPVTGFDGQPVGRWLRGFPDGSGRYSITVGAGGVVLVSTDNGVTYADFLGSPNPCAAAG